MAQFRMALKYITETKSKTTIGQLILNASLMLLTEELMRDATRKMIDGLGRVRTVNATKIWKMISTNQEATLTASASAVTLKEFEEA